PRRESPRDGAGRDALLERRLPHRPRRNRLAGEEAGSRPRHAWRDEPDGLHAPPGSQEESADARGLLPRAAQFVRVRLGRQGPLPTKYEGGFFISRFGNFLGKRVVGFDVLHVRLVEKDGELAAEMTTFLDQLRRPIDLCQWNGKLYVLEYTTYDASRLSRLLGAP